MHNYENGFCCFFELKEQLQIKKYRLNVYDNSALCIMHYELCQGHWFPLCSRNILGCMRKE
jgi:hypothetical protein